MQNKRRALVTLLLACACVALAQENTSDEAPLTTESSRANQSAQPPTVTDTGSGVENADTDGFRETNDEGTRTSPPEGSASADPSPMSAEPDTIEAERRVDDYRATERISEDRSVSFPVDI